MFSHEVTTTGDVYHNDDRTKFVVRTFIARNDEEGEIWTVDVRECDEPAPESGHLKETDNVTKLRYTGDEARQKSQEAVELLTEGFETIEARSDR